MTLLKTQKILLKLGTGLLLVQIPWFLVVQSIVNKTQVKTVATVIRIVSKNTICTGDRPKRPDRTCDHSPSEYPVYEYKDTSGKRYGQDDRFFGEFKQNNPIRGLFWKDVGDKVTAYYTKDKPQEILFLSGPFSYTAWVIPIFISIPMLLVVVILAIVQWLRKRYHSI